MDGYVIKNNEEDKMGYRDYRFVDLNGNPVKRTPWMYPYNYDDYVIWKHEDFKEGWKAVYSDRMMSWDFDKFNRCCQEVFGDRGQFFDNLDERTPKDIEKFLCMYFEKEIKLTAIVQGCNQSNGNPLWVFIYEE